MPASSPHTAPGDRRPAGRRRSQSVLKAEGCCRGRWFVVSLPPASVLRFISSSAGGRSLHPMNPDSLRDLDRLGAPAFRRPQLTRQPRSPGSCWKALAPHC